MGPILLVKLHDQWQQEEGATATTTFVDENRYSRRSIETLVVVLAVITIVGVIAGMVARLCGGRHFGRNGEHDIEGWVERRCRSCIDGGVSSEPPPPPEEQKPAKEEVKK